MYIYISSSYIPHYIQYVLNCFFTFYAILYIYSTHVNIIYI